MINAECPIIVIIGHSKERWNMEVTQTFNEKLFRKRSDMANFIINQLVKDEIFHDAFMNTLRWELLKHRPEDVEINKPDN